LYVICLKDIDLDFDRLYYLGTVKFKQKYIKYIYLTMYVPKYVLRIPQARSSLKVHDFSNIHLSRDKHVVSTGNIKNDKMFKSNVISSEQLG